MNFFSLLKNLEHQYQSVVFNHTYLYIRGVTTSWNFFVHNTTSWMFGIFFDSENIVGLFEVLFIRYLFCCFFCCVFWSSIFLRVKFRGIFCKFKSLIFPREDSFRNCVHLKETLAVFKRASKQNFCSALLDGYQTDWFFCWLVIEMPLKILCVGNGAASHYL